ncbi:hypothetical protein U1872_04360 [Sphingomonas sp. RB3P16]
MTVIDAHISDIRARLDTAAKLSPVGDNSVCIIDITCCIIDCSKCTPDDMSIYENPATILEHFIFRLRGQEKVLDAPVYYLPEGSARAAFAVGHAALQIPGGHAAGHLVGLAGELFEKATLERKHIAATAPVIAAVPAAAH